jgi:hypothetical protein
MQDNKMIHAAAKAKARNQQMSYHLQIQLFSLHTPTNRLTVVHILALYKRAPLPDRNSKKQALQDI